MNSANADRPRCTVVIATDPRSPLRRLFGVDRVVIEDAPVLDEAYLSRLAERLGFSRSLDTTP